MQPSLPRLWSSGVGTGEVLGVPGEQLVQELAGADFAGELSPHVRIALFLGSLAFLSSALVTMTAFTRIVIVLSFVRRALATQEIPPTPVVLGLSLFLTMFVMAPTFQAIEQDALLPWFEDEITSVEAVTRGSRHLKAFMIRQTRVEDIQLLLDIQAHAQTSRPGSRSLASEASTEPSVLIESPEQTPLPILVPAFVLSELKTSFIMGFCLYLPFVLIDLVVSVILMALGMMMMPPVVISAPCKLLLFVLVDGWNLVVRALSLSFY